MAIGGGVGRRQRNAIPPNTIALISAPASAEFQCKRPDEDARMDDDEEAVALGSFVFGSFVEEEERAIDLYSGVCRARAIWPSVVKIMSSCIGWTMPPRTSR
jgi:hypothetical protein